MLHLALAGLSNMLVVSWLGETGISGTANNLVRGVNLDDAVKSAKKSFEIAKEKCKKAKSRTPNFDLEKNLKAISTTTDTEFYNSFIDAVKLACA